GVSAGDKAERRRILAGNGQQRLGGLGGVAGLLAALRLPPCPRLSCAGGVVLDRQLSVARRLPREELGAEEPRVDDRGGDPERLDLVLQRLHPPLQAELRGGVGGTELKADEDRARRDRDDVARALLAHDGQDGAGDVHRADEACRQLPLDLLRCQLLEVARIEVGGVVDEHVDAAESIHGGLHRGLRVLRAGDVQLDDEQVAGLADSLRHGVGVAAGGDDCVPSGQGSLGEIYAHSTACAGNKPNVLISHRTSYCGLVEDPGEYAYRSSCCLSVWSHALSQLDLPWKKSPAFLQKQRRMFSVWW